MFRLNSWPYWMSLATYVVVGLLVRQGEAFQASSRCGAHSSTPPARVQKQSLSNFALYSTTSKSIAEQAKTASIDSLKKLLERQKGEVEETERLIRRLEHAQQGTSLSADAFEGDEDVNDFDHLSTATSILAGFDYGFKSRSEGPTIAELKSASPAFEGLGPPANLWTLGKKQFMRNLRAMVGEYRDEEDADLTPKQREYQAALEKLTLSSDAIWEREIADGPIEAPWVIKFPYLFLCYLLDRVFEKEYVPYRFFLLETVARMPYFSYIAALHLYETLGFWRRSADIKRIHFAEEMNEFRHLLIMESLGGDQAYWVRFMAQHSAIVYFIGLCFLWALSPSLSYRFSELLETHAVNTYGQFLDENEEMLKKLPPPMAAVEYYSFGTSDPFYAEFQTAALAEGKEIRRPGESMRSMYDTFEAIRQDEGDHVSTMHACLDPNATLRSVSMERRILYGTALAALAAAVVGSGSFDMLQDTTLTDGAAVTEGSSAISAAVEALVGAAAGLSSFGDSLMEDTEIAQQAAGTEIVEAGMLASLPVVIRQIAGVLAQILTRIL